MENQSEFTHHLCLVLFLSLDHATIQITLEEQLQHIKMEYYSCSSLVPPYSCPLVILCSYPSSDLSILFPPNGCGCSCSIRWIRNERPLSNVCFQDIYMLTLIVCAR